jgi:hypothetical protein
MKHTLTPHRRAAAWLFAAAALPFTPLAAQDVPIVNAPPPVIAAPAPAPAPALPPISVAPAPRPVTMTPAPAPRAARAPAPAVTRTATRSVRTATRTTASPRAQAPVRQTAATPAPAPALVAAAPEPVPVTTSTATPVNAPAPAQAGTTAPQTGIWAIWPWLLGGAVLLIVAIAFFARRRRVAEEEVYYEEAYEEPVVEAAPEPSFTPAEPIVAAAPVVEREPLADEVALVDSDAADVEALAAGSEPVAGRPWLEFLMRPVRAGTSRDDAIVQFELTVGNTGSVAARDVKISTWMVAGGQGTDMERALIDAPADATVSEVDIPAGDGARVDGQIALSKDGLTEPVLPVLVADARYTLPDGSEGRTHASFAVGVVEGDELAPFPIDRSSGLRENVEARLHGEPERV